MCTELLLSLLVLGLALKWEGILAPLLLMLITRDIYMESKKWTVGKLTPGKLQPDPLWNLLDIDPDLLVFALSKLVPGQQLLRGHLDEKLPS
jgi:hypothetical protein